jgi:hypothetical protein
MTRLWNTELDKRHGSIEGLRQAKKQLEIFRKLCDSLVKDTRNSNGIQHHYYDRAVS